MATYTGWYVLPSQRRARVYLFSFTILIEMDSAEMYFPLVNKLIQP